MILYFADRNMNIIGQASTELPEGLVVTQDLKTEDVETGVAVFECTIPYDSKTMDQVKKCTEVGNYILRSNRDENEFYTIIETEADTKDQSVYMYAEDAGLDLLNEVVGAYEADQDYPIRYYIEKFSFDSGFTIGINEASNLSRKLSWEGESTASERITSVATQFDNCEISYSFKVEGLVVTGKYINIYRKRGKDDGVQLHLNREIDSIITKKSIANLATALLCTGGTPEPEEGETTEEEKPPITLDGYSYDDGNYHTSGPYLMSREALKQWSRYVWINEPNKTGDIGHIVKTFSYDTTSQQELCNRALTELKKACEIEVNYEVEISKLPENVRIGDRVNIIDDSGQLYLSTRILKLENSIADQTQKATLGEFLLKGSGIAQKVADLADQFAKDSISADRALQIAKKAKEDADAAKKKAESATADADKAHQAADAAQKAAADADAKADTAAQDLEAAKQNLQDVTNRVGATEEEVAAAQAAVDAAQKAADKAAADATAAQGKADEAKQNATAAQQEADNAKTAADKAQADAAAAQKAADKAQADADALAVRVTQAETKITQNSEAIELSASKIQEVDDNLDKNYYTRTETDAKIKVVSDSITSTVKTEVSQEVGKIQIGAKNLVLDSKDKVTSTSYYIKKYYLSEKWIEGETYTISFKGTKKEGSFLICRDSGTKNITFEAPYNEDRGMYIYTFECPPKHVDDTGENMISFYNYPNTASHDCTIESVKLEKGNKATDWTPAPEDMATGEEVENAQASADKAQQSVDATGSRVTVAESTIKQLSDSISHLVTDKNGTSLMTQTSNGWTFNMGQISDTLDQAASELDKLSGSVDGIDDTINKLNSVVDDLGKKTAYIVMATDESGNPCIELGKEGNPFKVRITNTSVDFMDGSSKVAYVSNKALYIEKAIIKDELQIGEGSGFVWKRRSNGNMGLRWVEG